VVPPATNFVSVMPPVFSVPPRNRFWYRFSVRMVRESGELLRYTTRWLPVILGVRGSTSARMV
jgi:hypothetical protein